MKSPWWIFSCVVTTNFIVRDPFGLFLYRRGLSIHVVGAGDIESILQRRFSSLKL